MWEVPAKLEPKSHYYSGVTPSQVRPVVYRIASSFAAIAAAWLSAAVGFGIYSRSAYGVVVALISTISIFAIAWILVGIPAVAAGHLLVQMPPWFVGLLGAIAGAIILFALDHEEQLSPVYFGFLALASVSGAAGMITYRLLIETKAKN